MRVSTSRRFFPRVTPLLMHKIIYTTLICNNTERFLSRVHQKHELAPIIDGRGRRSRVCESTECHVQSVWSHVLHAVHFLHTRYVVVLRNMYSSMLCCVFVPCLLFLASSKMDPFFLFSNAD